MPSEDERKWSESTACGGCSCKVAVHATGIGCLACPCPAVNWLEDGEVMAWQKLNMPAWEEYQRARA